VEYRGVMLSKPSMLYRRTGIGAARPAVTAFANNASRFKPRMNRRIKSILRALGEWPSAIGNQASSRRKWVSLNGYDKILFQKNKSQEGREFMELEATQPRILDRKTAFAGANWFFWLAALSAINSLIVYFVGIRNLPFAFGVTQWFDGTHGPLTAEGWTPPLKLTGLAMDLLIAAGFAGFGYLARHRNDVAFVLGIFLYVVDALLSIGLREFWGFSFHLVGFFFLFRGLLASRHVRENATTY